MNRTRLIRSSNFGVNSEDHSKPSSGRRGGGGHVKHEDASGYDAMTITQLQDRAHDLGLPDYLGLSREDLIVAIRNR